MEGLLAEITQPVLYQSWTGCTILSGPRKTSSLWALLEYTPIAFCGRNEYSAETSAPYTHKSSAFPLQPCSYLRSSSCLRRLCFSFCMFLETLNTSLGEGDFKRGNKLMGEEIQRSLSQGHSWYCSKIRACPMLGGFGGSRTAAGSGMAGLYPSSPVLLQCEGRLPLFSFHIPVSSAARDGKDAQCQLDLKHPNV